MSVRTRFARVLPALALVLSLGGAAVAQEDDGPTLQPPTADPVDPPPATDPVDPPPADEPPPAAAEPTEPAAEQPPAEQPSAEQPPAEQPPAEPAGQMPAEPAADPAAQRPFNSTSGQQPMPEPFPRKIRAPRLEGGVEWLNSAGPIQLSKLKGKVVLLDLWTFF